MNLRTGGVKNLKILQTSPKQEQFCVRLFPPLLMNSTTDGSSLKSIPFDLYLSFVIPPVVKNVPISQSNSLSHVYQSPHCDRCGRSQED